MNNKQKFSQPHVACHSRIFNVSFPQSLSGNPLRGYCHSRAGGNPLRIISLVIAQIFLVQTVLWAAPVSSARTTTLRVHQMTGVNNPDAKASNDRIREAMTVLGASPEDILVDQEKQASNQSAALIAQYKEDIFAILIKQVPWFLNAEYLHGAIRSKIQSLTDMTQTKMNNSDGNVHLTFTEDKEDKALIMVKISGKKDGEQAEFTISVTPDGARLVSSAEVLAWRMEELGISRFVSDETIITELISNRSKMVEHITGTDGASNPIGVSIGKQLVEAGAVGAYAADGQLVIVSADLLPEIDGISLPVLIKWGITGFTGNKENTLPRINRGTMEIITNAKGESTIYTKDAAQSSVANGRARGAFHSRQKVASAQGKFILISTELVQNIPDADLLSLTSGEKEAQRFLASNLSAKAVEALDKHFITTLKDSGFADLIPPDGSLAKYIRMGSSYRIQDAGTVSFEFADLLAGRSQVAAECILHGDHKVFSIFVHNNGTIGETIEKVTISSGEKVLALNEFDKIIESAREIAQAIVKQGADDAPLLEDLWQEEPDKLITMVKDLAQKAQAEGAASLDINYTHYNAGSQTEGKTLTLTAGLFTVSADGAGTAGHIRVQTSSRPFVAETATDRQRKELLEEPLTMPEDGQGERRDFNVNITEFLATKLDSSDDDILQASNQLAVASEISAGVEKKLLPILRVLLDDDAITTGRFTDALNLIMKDSASERRIAGDIISISLTGTEQVLTRGPVYYLRICTSCAYNNQTTLVFNPDRAIEQGRNLGQDFQISSYMKPHVRHICTIDKYTVAEDNIMWAPNTSVQTLLQYLIAPREMPYKLMAQLFDEESTFTFSSKISSEINDKILPILRLFFNQDSLNMNVFGAILRDAALRDADFHGGEILHLSLYKVPTGDAGETMGVKFMTDQGEIIDVVFDQKSMQGTQKAVEHNEKTAICDIDVRTPIVSFDKNVMDVLHALFGDDPLLVSVSKWSTLASNHLTFSPQIEQAVEQRFLPIIRLLWNDPHLTMNELQSTLASIVKRTESGSISPLNSLTLFAPREGEATEALRLLITTEQGKNFDIILFDGSRDGVVVVDDQVMDGLGIGSITAAAKTPNIRFSEKAREIITQALAPNTIPADFDVSIFTIASNGGMSIAKSRAQLAQLKKAGNPVDVYEYQNYPVAQIVTPGKHASLDICPAKGNGILSWEVNGREILFPTTKMKKTRGIPWMMPAGRVAGGKINILTNPAAGAYTPFNLFEKLGPLAGNDGNGNAIHGSPRNRVWSVDAISQDANGTTIMSALNYEGLPEAEVLGNLFFEMLYRITGNTLMKQQTTMNNDTIKRAITHAWHDWFNTPNPDNIMVVLPARQFCEAQELIPTGTLLPVSQLGIGPHKVLSLAGKSGQFDYVMTDLIYDADGWARSYLYDATDGTLITVLQDETMTDLVFFNGVDGAVCIEAERGFHDAHNLAARGIDSHLLWISPGESVKSESMVNVTTIQAGMTAEELQRYIDTIRKAASKTLQLASNVKVTNLSDLSDAAESIAHVAGGTIDSSVLNVAVKRAVARVLPDGGEIIITKVKPSVSERGAHCAHIEFDLTYNRGKDSLVETMTLTGTVNTHKDDSLAAKVSLVSYQHLAQRMYDELGKAMEKLVLVIEGNGTLQLRETFAQLRDGRTSGDIQDITLWNAVGRLVNADDITRVLAAYKEWAKRPHSSQAWRAALDALSMARTRLKDRLALLSSQAFVGRQRTVITAMPGITDMIPAVRRSIETNAETGITVVIATGTEHIPDEQVKTDILNATQDIRLPFQVYTREQAEAGGLDNGQKRFEELFFFARDFTAGGRNAPLALEQSITYSQANSRIPVMIAMNALEEAELHSMAEALGLQGKYEILRADLLGLVEFFEQHMQEFRGVDGLAVDFNVRAMNLTDLLKKYPEIRGTLL